MIRTYSRLPPIRPIRIFDDLLDGKNGQFSPDLIHAHERVWVNGEPLCGATDVIAGNLFIVCTNPTGHDGVHNCLTPDGKEISPSWAHDTSAPQGDK